jgi:outer membrane lipoprotein
MMSRKLIVPVLFALLLPGCAGMPEFDTSGVDRSLTPQSVNAEPEASRGKVALWGGTILETRNLKTTTQIEMLAYPLDADYRPMLESKPLGRFIIEHAGYIEPTTYAQGKQLTVLGNVSGSQNGSVGETSYTYPVISDSQLHLWSPSDGGRTSVHFGLGVGIGL